MVQVIDQQPPAGAKSPMRYRMAGITFNLNRATVFDAQAHTTTGMAQAAVGPTSFRHARTPFPEVPILTS